MTRIKRTVRPIEYFACYAAWLALCVLGGLIVQYWLGLIPVVSLSLRANPWVAQAYRQLSLPILGLAWLIMIFWLEHYLRKGVQIGRLWPRAAKVAAALIGIIAVLLILNQVL